MLTGFSAFVQSMRSSIKMQEASALRYARFKCTHAITCRAVEDVNEFIQLETISMRGESNDIEPPGQERFVFIFQALIEMNGHVVNS